MLDLEQITQAQNADVKVVNIKAWGGEVKIRPLSIKERTEIFSLSQDGAEYDEKGVLKKYSIKNLTNAQILTAHYALIEPKLSIKEIENLSEKAFNGVKEICDEVEKLASKK